MTLYIGRLGLDVAQDTFDTFDMSGQKVAVSGQLIGTSLNQLQGLRQNLLGMEGNIEPVYWSEDAWAGGYYRVTSTSVKLHKISLVTFDATFSATLERIGGTQLPTIETFSFGAPRVGYANNPTSWVAQPSAAIGQSFSGNTGQGSQNRTGPGPLGVSCTLKTFVSAASTSAYLFNSTNKYTILPANYYDGAPTLKVDGRVIVGDAVPSVGNTADWEINNGLVKVVPGATGMISVTVPVYAANTTWATAMEFSPQFYSGGAWASIGQGTTPPTIDSVAVTVNTAECVSVRLTSTALFPSAMRDYIDLTLRRGSRVLEVGTSSLLTVPWGILAHSGTWATTSTQIMYESADNGDGNRYMLTGNLALSTANKRIGDSAQSLTYAQFGIGAVVGGTASAASPDTATEIRNQYFAAITESTRFSRP